MSWAQKYLANVSAVFIPGVQNVQADFLSRTQLDNNEWSLHVQTSENDWFNYFFLHELKEEVLEKSL